jgi:hypothetical protein
MTTTLTVHHAALAMTIALPVHHAALAMTTTLPVHHAALNVSSLSLKEVLPVCSKLSWDYKTPRPCAASACP